MSYDTTLLPPVSSLHVIIWTVSCLFLLAYPHAAAKLNQPKGDGLGSHEPYQIPDYKENGWLRNSRTSYLDPHLSTADEIAGTCMTRKRHPVTILGQFTPHLHHTILSLQFAVDSTIKLLVINIQGPEPTCLQIINPSDLVINRRQKRKRSIRHSVHFPGDDVITYVNDHVSGDTKNRKKPITRRSHQLRRRHRRQSDSVNLYIPSLPHSVVEEWMQGHEASKSNHVTTHQPSLFTKSQPRPSSYTKVDYHQHSQQQQQHHYQSQQQELISGVDGAVLFGEETFPETQPKQSRPKPKQQQQSEQQRQQTEQQPYSNRQPYRGPERSKQEHSYAPGQRDLESVPIIDYDDRFDVQEHTKRQKQSRQQQEQPQRRQLQAPTPSMQQQQQQQQQDSKQQQKSIIIPSVLAYEDDEEPQPTPLTFYLQDDTGQVGYQNGKQIFWNNLPPQQGLWRLNVDDSRSRTTVTIQAMGSIDFTFQLLDIETGEPMTSLPVAGDPAVARVDIEDLDCISHQDLAIKFYTEDYDSIHSSIFQADAKMNHPQTIRLYFKMPSKPFYPVLVGTDLNGSQFQRWNSDLITPRVFIVSMATRSTEQLYPGVEYAFGVNVENMACRSGLFNITALLDQATVNHFSIQAPSILEEIKPHSWKQRDVVVSVWPSISAIERRILTIRVSCSGDAGQIEKFQIPLKAYPASYQSDFEAPTYSVVETCGLCDPSLPCANQMWGFRISVQDKMTGVRNVSIKNGAEDTEYYVRGDGTTTGVRIKAEENGSNYDDMNTSGCSDWMKTRDVRKAYRYSGSDSHRTAEVTYTSNCCYVRFVLAATDYVDNKASYPISAPVKMITVASGQPLIDIKTTRAPTGSANIASTAKAPTSVLSSSTTSNTFPPSTASFKSTTTSSWSISSPSTAKATETTQEDITVVVLPHSDVKTKESQVVKSMHSTWLDNNFSPFRIVAIVLGCIAGLAGIGIVVICIIYKYRYKLLMRIRMRAVIKQRKRRERTGSDITMGSSMESRSANGSFCSARSSPLGGSVRSDFSGVSKESERELTHFRHNNRENVRFLFNGKSSTSTLGKQESNGTVVGTCETCIHGDPNQSGEKCECTTSGGSGNSSLSVAGRLKRGGHIYVSMVDVQRRMEEIEGLQKRIRERAAEVKRGGTAASSKPSNKNNQFEPTGQVGFCREGDNSPASQRRQRNSSEEGEADENERYRTVTGQISSRRRRVTSGESGYATNSARNSTSDKSSCDESPSFSCPGSPSNANRASPYGIEADDHNDQDDIGYDDVKMSPDSSYGKLANLYHDVPYTAGHHPRPDVTCTQFEGDRFTPRRRSQSHGVVCVKQNSVGPSGHHNDSSRADDDICVDSLPFHRATLMQESSTGEVRRVPVLVRSLPKRFRPCPQNSGDLDRTSNIFMSGADRNMSARPP